MEAMPVLFINNSCSTDPDHSQMWMEPLQGLHKAFYSKSIVQPRKRVNLHSQRSQDLQPPHPGKVGALVGRVGKNAPCPILRSSLRTTSAWEEAAMPATRIFHQGWLKSTRNSYLNTGSFPRNHIWMCGVLKKSIFAYLKFHICIPKILHSYYHRP